MKLAYPLALVAIVAVGVAWKSTSWLDRFKYEDPSNIYSGRFVICTGASNGGDLCGVRQFIDMNFDLNGTPYSIIETAWHDPVSKHGILLTTPAALVREGYRLCANPVELSINAESTLTEVSPNGDFGKKSLISVEQRAKLRSRLRANNPESAVGTICFAIRKLDAPSNKFAQDDFARSTFGMPTDSTQVYVFSTDNRNGRAALRPRPRQEMAGVI